MTDQSMTLSPRLAIRPIADSALAAITDAVVASLPISLDHGQEGPLAAVPGAGDWTVQAAALLADGVRGVLVDRPEAVTVDALAALRAAAMQTQASVVLRLPWVSHPTVADAVAAWSPVREELVVVDTVVTGQRQGSNATMAVAQLVLTMALVGPIHMLSVDACDSQGYALRGTTRDGVPVSLMAATGFGASAATVRLLGRMEAFELAVEESATWKPGLAFRASAGGETWQPQVFESADRSAWRALHQAVAHTPAVDMDLYADALGLIASVGGLV